MITLAERFSSKVDRSGEHHVWTGSKKSDGSGKMKVNGRTILARRVAWELTNGELSHNVRVLACPEDPRCVRIDHLILEGAAPRRSPARQPNGSRSRARGSGSMREIKRGIWELSATAGRYSDGTARRVYRNVRVRSAAAAAAQLASFVAEVRSEPPVMNKDLRDIKMDAAVELFLTEHLRDEKGRTEKTIGDYRKLHAKWFSPTIGKKAVRDVDESDLDKLFGRMRTAGLSRSRLNQARSLYVPFFRWAKSRRIITRHPMSDFLLPTSTYISKERTPPEVDELSHLLREALDIVPDIAVLLVLGAVTGMRRGELVALRWSRIRWDEARVIVDAAIDEGRRVKSTKTRKERAFYVDAETLEMLRRHQDRMKERCLTFGTDLGTDAFLFSLAADCSTPMPPDYVTKRVGVLKDHLGIADKRSDTIALEDKALRLYRHGTQARPAGKTGPDPKGALSYREIGARLGRSDRWAALAIASAQRREQAGERGAGLNFDGSILALRKFTSSELLDAGFNISMVAQRQGHGPQVLMKHYSKSRRSADRKAAEHLGRVVHGAPRI
ncbi:MAG TPA: tyrosine-type recombinase/integrase [Acidimicrobiales bacterium]|nr:tyrosine-type recombinase/integrase [Acidimicrobiales bacterium]